MINDRIKVMIRDYNPWWEGKPEQLPEYKRYIFSDVLRYLEKRQIIAIVGLRRVGKTILMKQIIQGLSVKKENIFYFLFDDLITQNPEIIEDILDYYIKTIAKEGKKYVFLDEIQKVPYWQDVLKRFYDTRDDVKFIVSGSSSLQIKKSKESLAGRIFDFYLPVLTFREFLEINGLKIQEAELDFNRLKEVYEKNIHRKSMFENMLLDYVFKGAFPEIAKESDEGVIKNYIKSSVLEKIIFEDIPIVFDIKRKDVLFSTLEYCSKETSNLLDITNLANTLSVNYQTLRSYLFYLQNSFLIDILYNYSKSIAKQLRKNKKVHIAHPCITITMMRYSRDILGIGEVVSKYIETIVFQHSKLINERISFWRTPQKEEVDIVIDDKELLPIEVKYKTIERSDVKWITKFMNRFESKTGIVVTKDFFEKRRVDDKEILFIPAWLFLLSV